MRGWLWICFAVLVVGLIGCAPTRKVVKERTLSLGEVVRLVQERNQQIRTMRGEGTITVESPEASGSGSFDVEVKKPDSLCMDLSGPFGIHVGTLVLSREQYLYYNWMDNAAVVGKPNGKTLNDLFRLRLEFDKILNAFTGEFPFPTNQDSVEQFTVENDLYFIRYHTGDEVREYRIDGDAFVVRGYRIVDRAGKPVLTAMASDIDEDAEIVMPKLLRIVFPTERRSVTVAYDEVEFNEPVVCSFTLPKHAEIIYR